MEQLGVKLEPTWGVGVIGGRLACCAMVPALPAVLWGTCAYQQKAHVAEMSSYVWVLLLVMFVCYSELLMLCQHRLKPVPYKQRKISNSFFFHKFFQRIKNYLAIFKYLVFGANEVAMLSLPLIL